MESAKERVGGSDRVFCCVSKSRGRALTVECPASHVTSERKPKREARVWAAQEKRPVHAHIRTRMQTCRLSEHPTHTHTQENRNIRMDQRLGAGLYPDSPPSRPRDVLVKSGKMIYSKITASQPRFITIILKEWQTVGFCLCLRSESFCEMGLSAWDDFMHNSSKSRFLLNLCGSYYESFMNIRMHTWITSTRSIKHPFACNFFRDFAQIIISLWATSRKWD